MKARRLAVWQLLRNSWKYEEIAGEISTRDQTHIRNRLLDLLVYAAENARSLGLQQPLRLPRRYSGALVHFVKYCKTPILSV